MPPRRSEANMKKDENLYCKCGFPVRVLYHWKTDAPSFWTADISKQIDRCPDCGEQLRRDRLVELGELEL